MEKEANEKRLEILVKRKGECDSMKESNLRDIEVKWKGLVVTLQ